VSPWPEDQGQHDPDRAAEQGASGVVDDVGDVAGAVDAGQRQL
jgi:hypothetical protein